VLPKERGRIREDFEVPPADVEGMPESRRFRLPVARQNATHWIDVEDTVPGQWRAVLAEMSLGQLRRWINLYSVNVLAVHERDGEQGGGQRPQKALMAFLSCIIGQSGQFDYPAEQ
jgi:hypothetical protein